MFQALRVQGSYYVAQDHFKEMLQLKLVTADNLQAVYMFEDFYFLVPEKNVRRLDTVITDIDTKVNETTNPVDTEGLIVKYKLSKEEKEFSFSASGVVLIGLSRLSCVEDKYNKRLLFPVVRVRGKVFIICNRILDRGTLDKAYMLET